MKKEKFKKLGVLGVVQIIFLVLKLTGLVDWSWWWVVTPLMIELLLMIGSVVFFVVLKNKLGR